MWGGNLGVEQIFLIMAQNPKAVREKIDKFN